MISFHFFVVLLIIIIFDPNPIYLILFNPNQSIQSSSSRIISFYSTFINSLPKKKNLQQKYMEFYNNNTFKMSDVKTEKSVLIDNDNDNQFFQCKVFENQENYKSPFEYSDSPKYKSAIQRIKQKRAPTLKVVSFGGAQLQDQMSKSLNYEARSGLFCHDSPHPKRQKLPTQSKSLLFNGLKIQQNKTKTEKSIVDQQYFLNNILSKYSNQALIKDLKSVLKLIKFFEYVYDFKTCKIGSYAINRKFLANQNIDQSEFQLNLNQLSRSQSYQMVNQVSAQNYNQNTGINTSQKSCSSTYSNGQTRLVSFKDLQLKTICQQNQNLCQKQKQVHFGYSCDRCAMDPIVGDRYRCDTCDFDLCSQCFIVVQNSFEMQEHQMKLVRISLKRHYNKLSQVLVKSQQFNNRQSLKSFKGVKSAIIKKKTQNKTSYQNLRKTVKA